MTYAEAKTFILPLIHELTGILCIWERQNKPRPSSAHLGLQLSPERDNGTEVRRRNDGTGVLDIIGRKETTLSVNGYGSGIIEKLNMLWLSLQRPTIVDRCFVAGVAFTQVEPVQDLTALLDDVRWEERANLDLIVTYSRAVTDEPGIITTVKATGELGEPDPVQPVTDPAIAEVTISMKGVQ